MSVAQRVDGDHFELPADAVELLRQVRPDDRQRFIEEVTEALAVAADTKDFAQLQRVLAAWAATIRLQRRPGYEAMVRGMQRRERERLVRRHADEMCGEAVVSRGDELFHRRRAQRFQVRRGDRGLRRPVLLLPLQPAPHALPRTRLRSSTRPWLLRCRRRAPSRA